MKTLSKAQAEQFYRDGYLFLENVIPANKLLKLQTEFEQWKDESRNHSEPYGVTLIIAHVLI